VDSIIRKLASVEEITDTDMDGVIDFREEELMSPPNISAVISLGMEVSIPPTEQLQIVDLPIIQIQNTSSFVPTYADGVGRLVYEIPTEMVKFRTYKIEVRIGESETDISIVQNINPIVDVTIRTSELMQVELVDPTNNSFTIVSQSAQQLIEVDEFTAWVFYVTPLRHGKNYISVVVSIVRDGNLKQSVYEDYILVETSNWIEIETFISNYWQWIVGFIVSTLIPFGIWLLKYFKNKK